MVERICAPVALWIGTPLHCVTTTNTHLWVRINLVAADETGIQREMKYATELKAKGGILFATENWDQAAACYKEALGWVLKGKDRLIKNKERGNGADTTATQLAEKEADTLRVLCHLNTASCHLNNGKPRRAVSRCTRALTIDRTSTKGLARRAKAYKMLRLYDQALDDLREAFRIDPKDEVLAKKIKKITCIKRS